MSAHKERLWSTAICLLLFCIPIFSTNAFADIIGLSSTKNNLGQITSVKVNTKAATTMVLIGLNGTAQSATGTTTNGFITFPFTAEKSAGTVTVVVGNMSWAQRVPNSITESEQERLAKIEERLKALKRLSGLPFDNSSSVAFVSDLPATPGVFDDIQLTNSSSSTSYEFSSLQVFVDLDPTFFTQSAFDSTQAIATGMLNSDISNVDVGPDSFIDFGAGPLIPDTYVLVLGTASPILSDGSLGSPTNFSFADLAVVPEPDTLTLIASGFLLLILFRVLRPDKCGTALADGKEPAA